MRTKKNFAVIMCVAICIFSLGGFSAFASTTEIGKEPTIYNDWQGGQVLSNMPGEIIATPEECLALKQNLDQFVEEQKALEVNSRSSATTYDIEDDPILIGHWNLGDCGKSDNSTYARHTLGTYSNGNLTTVGRCTWYNSSGKVALPYRNGASEYKEHQVADVLSGIYFHMRDLSTNVDLDVYRSDFGPNQCPNSENLRSTICDLDTVSFKKFHGNTSDGVFDCRTYVPINNYNPSN